MTRQPWQQMQNRFGLLFRAILLGLWGIGLLLTPACTGQANSQATSSQPSGLTAYANRPILTDTATVDMIVNTSAGKGSITLELDGKAAPLTAGNFVDLVQKGFYDGLTFHRVEKDPQPFVIQGGDPKGNGTGGYEDPVSLRPRQIPLEIAFKGESQPRYNQPTTAVSPDALLLPHKLGAVAMARSNAPDSASSQFYIGLSALPILDGRYAVFGYVTSGMDVVNQVKVGDVIEKAQVVAGAENLSTLQP
ncbi:MAG: peptidylprolyl isomerase [Cyanobacteriota bacterium]|nr:peptidylprolyl isomerase [Cyanobacteriota bacterium]